jgi:hypothetical protein
MSRGSCPQPPYCRRGRSHEISVSIATVRIRGAVDTRSLAAVLKALKVLA